MLISSGPFTLRKFNLHSVATAFASNVLPVPIYIQLLFHQEIKYNNNNNTWRAE